MYKRQILFSFDQYQTQQNDRIVFYHDYRSNAIEIFDRHQSILIADEEMTEYSGAFINAPLRNELGITKSIALDRSVVDTVLHSNYINRNIIYNDQWKILTIASMDDIKNVSEANWDYVYLINNPKVTISEINENVSFEKLVIGASNWRWSIEKWIDECEDQQIDYHNIAQQNALIIESS